MSLFHRVYACVWLVAWCLYQRTSAMHWYTTYLFTHTWLKYMESATNSRWMRKDERWNEANHEGTSHTFTFCSATTHWCMCARVCVFVFKKNSRVILPWQGITNNALEWNCRDTWGMYVQCMEEAGKTRLRSKRQREGEGYEEERKIKTSAE